MPGHDPGLLVVASSVSCELKDLSTEVLKDSSEIDTYDERSVVFVTLGTTGGGVRYGGVPHRRQRLP